MKSLTVVKHLELFKYVLLSLSSGLIALMMNQFCFQGMKEAFRNRIIPTIPFTAHTLSNAVLL
jgi:hypothetical protein